PDPGPGAGAGGDQLRAGRGAVHLAAEQAVGGGDAGHVRAVRALDEADVDEVGLLADPVAAVGVHRDVLADLHAERLALGDVGLRVVGAEVPDVEHVLVGLHRGVVREVLVVVQVDADRARLGVVEDAPGVGGVAVEVGVAVRVTAGGVRLQEGADAVVARRGLPGLAVVGEAGPGHGRHHGTPGPVVVHDRVGRRDPVDDLPLAGGGLLQRGVAEVHAGVEDADGDAAAVRLAVVLDEVDGAGLEGRVVRVLGRGPLVGRLVGALAALALGALGGVGARRRVVERDLLAQVDAVHGGELRGGGDGRVRLGGGDGGADVAQLVVGVPDGAALDRVQLLGDLLGLPGRRGDHHGDVLGALGLGLGEQVGVLRPQLVGRGLDVPVDRGGGRRVGGESHGDRPGRGERGDQAGGHGDAGDASRARYRVALRGMGHRHPLK